MYHSLSIASAFTTFCPPDWSWEVNQGLGGDHWSDYDLWVVRAGGGTFVTPSQKHQLRPGDCFILRGGEPYRGYADHDNPPVVTHIHFDYVDSENKALRPYPGVANEHRRFDDPGFFTILLDRIVEAYHSLGTEKMLTAWLEAALYEIQRYDKIQSQLGEDGSHREMINRICEEILAHPEGDYPLATLASRIGVSPHHFGRLFKEQRDVTPGAFIVQSRISKAKDLIRHSNYTISRIAELLGYCDVYHFSRQFHRQTGVSPTAYRRFDQ